MSLGTRISALVLCLALLATVGFFVTELIIELQNSKEASEITEEQAEELLLSEIKRLPVVTARSCKYVANNIKLDVTDIRYGHEKNIFITCNYETIDASSILLPYTDKLIADMYTYYTENSSSSMNATELALTFGSELQSVLENAKSTSGTLEVVVYEQADGNRKLYLSEQTVNTLYGGLLSVQKKIQDTNSVKIDGEKIDISKFATIRRGANDIIAFRNYDSDVPQTKGWLLAYIDELADEFHRNFIEDNKWQYIVKGLGTTLAITGCAMLMGIVLGFAVAVVRVSYEKTGSMPILNGVCKAYLSIIRGTPVMIQLLIIYFVLLAPLQINKFIAAVICFGINSGAYVAEIVRGGIMSVDGGQLEAGRSLGLGYGTTMLYIVFPQAFKAVLPSLANEFIVLLKETSVAFYIGVADLTLGGLKIRSLTYSDFMPLLAVAVIYLILVLGLSYLVSLLERRLRKSER